MGVFSSKKNPRDNAANDGRNHAEYQTTRPVRPESNRTGHVPSRPALEGSEKSHADNGKKAVEKVKEIQKKLGTLLADEKAKQGMPFLTGETIPTVNRKTLDKKETQDAIDAVLKDILQRQTESETAKAVAQLKIADIDEATRNAEQTTADMENVTNAAAEVSKELRKQFRALNLALLPLRKSASGSLKQAIDAFDALNRNFHVAAQDFDAQRYDLEAKFNGSAAKMTKSASAAAAWNRTISASGARCFSTR